MIVRRDLVNTSKRPGFGRRLASALLACVPLMAAPAAGQVFMKLGPDGVPTFSDRPTDSALQPFLEVNASPASPASPASRASPASPASPAAVTPMSAPTQSAAAGTPRARALNQAITSAARANRIDPLLLHALVAVESDYDTRAVSPKGARGLTQLMPQTARDYGVSDPFDPVQNLHAGARLLRHLLDRFADDPPLALAAYNAGAGAVTAHGRQIPPFAETRRYVSQVLQRYAGLQAATAAAQ